MNSDVVTDGEVTLRRDIEEVIWNTESSDPDGTVLQSTIDAMAAYDDWHLGRYVSDHYLINHFMQVRDGTGTIRSGTEILSQGVHLGPADLAEAGVLWAKDSEYGGPSVLWAGNRFTPDWTNWYRAHLRCYAPSLVHYSCTHQTKVEIAPNLLDDCNGYTTAACGDGSEWRHCSSLPRGDQAGAIGGTGRGDLPGGV